ncbi:hypothetical protein [Haloferax volcanii]|uniref:hypothetical protein n=1 Tax=Haloferax volcanii TaxID=2246 RepID=UPI0023DB5002|nr:hypothetical protein [Haloferax lucentense]
MSETGLVMGFLCFANGGCFVSTELYDVSEFQASGVERFDHSQLDEGDQSVMSDLGVPNRIKDTLVGKATVSGARKRIKFATMNLYPSSRSDNPGAAEACYRNNIIGVGWGGAGDGENHSELSASDYTRRVFEQYGDEDSTAENDFAHFALWLSPGDIVITKNLGPVAKYGRVKGPMKHRDQSDAEDELREHSIGFYREVEWVDVSPEDAPAKVLSTTCRGTVTLPGLDRASMEQITDQFDSPIGDIDYELEEEELSAAFSELAERPANNKDNANRLIDSLSASGSYNGLETVVCTYIQAKTGAVMHPSSRSYPGIEAIFRTTGDQGPETYGVQVKRGSFSDKDKLKRFADRHDRLFLFSSAGDEIDHEDITNINQRDLSEYIINSSYDLPPVEVDRILRAREYMVE